MRDEPSKWINYGSSHNSLVRNYSRKHLYPVVKLFERKTHTPWNEVNCSGIVIKLQDLLTRKGKVTPLFKRIADAGGLHSYLDYNGVIILSSIMPDETIAGFPVDAYSDMITSLQPDFWITPDGETYFGEESRSCREIGRILNDTKKLLKECPENHLIGLVKGCNLSQIEAHTTAMLNLGITRFCFHASDFLRRGPVCMKHQAVEFTQAIRKLVPWLLIYGVGAASSFRKFHFADGYVTQSHFVNAGFGRFQNDTHHEKADEKVTRDDMMRILRTIEHSVIGIETQTNLSQWGKEGIKVPCSGLDLTNITGGN